MAMAAAGAYNQVFQSLVLAQRGSYGDLSYMPVFRASALFYAVVGERLNTRISFLNYWREKNGNADVGVLVTVRDEQGAKRARVYTRLEGMVYTFDLREMLDSSAPFKGSMELEAFSSHDMKFQFPGLSVFYETPAGVTYVHTNQRVYNDAQDRSRGEALNPWQTGFVINTARFDPFIFIVNGPHPFEGGDVPLRVLAENDGEREYTLALPALPAYGCLDLRLAQVPGLADYLGPRDGMCKINLPLQNVHLRLAAGNALKDGSWLSVTHTYFDAVAHDDYVETSQFEAGTVPAFIPFNLVDSLDVDLVLYPIYARGELQPSLQAFGADGQRRATIDLPSWRGPDDGLRRLDIRALLCQHGVPDTAGLYVLVIRSSEARVPARITYGLNFRVGQALGTNISASAYMAPSWEVGRRSWKWGPLVVRPGNRNLIMVSAFSKRSDAFVKRTAQVAIYGAAGLLTETAIRLDGNTGVTLVAEDLLEQAGAAAEAGAILWYVLRSEHTGMDANQVCISPEGLVGGDHAF